MVGTDEPRDIAYMGKRLSRYQGPWLVYCTNDSLFALDGSGIELIMLRLSPWTW